MIKIFNKKTLSIIFMITGIVVFLTAIILKIISLANNNISQDLIILLLIIGQFFLLLAVLFKPFQKQNKE